MSASDPEPMPLPPPKLPESISTPPAALSEAPKPVDGPALTPEEQMERFAQDLKENDWGHQPC